MLKKIRFSLSVIVFTITALFFLNTAQANTQLTLQKNYTQQSILGWKVFFANDVAKNKALYQSIKKQVTADLQKIIDATPAWSLTYLRETPIFFENGLAKPLGNNFFFNGSKKFSLKYKIQHTYGGVIAGNTRSYLAVKGIHPWQMLHELTHAYHQFNTGHNYQPIQQAYNNAMNKNLHKYGSHYPRKNKREYFSTLTEAYFGKKVVYPHNRKELAEHDPVGYCAIVKAWGLVGKQTGAIPLRCD